MQVFSLQHFFEEFLISNWNFTFWYLYAFILFLVSFPILRIFAKNRKIEHFKYLFVCVLVFKAVIPIVEYLVWQGKETVSENIRSLWITTDIFIYPLLGYFLEYRVEVKQTKKWILPLWVVNVLTMLITCLMTHFQIIVTGVCSENQSQTFFGCFTMVNVTTIYLFTKYLFTVWSVPSRIRAVISSLGGASFGIYLVHLFFLNLFPVAPRLWGLLEKTMGANSMLAAFLICFVVMGMSYIATLIMKKMPILKTLI